MMFTMVNAYVSIYDGSNATLKGIVKQLKIAEIIIRMSHLLLKLSFALKIKCFLF